MERLHHKVFEAYEWFPPSPENNQKGLVVVQFEHYGSDPDIYFQPVRIAMTAERAMEIGHRLIGLAMKVTQPKPHDLLHVPAPCCNAKDLLTSKNAGQFKSNPSLKRRKK